MNIVEKFKTLPSTLGIKINKNHFKFLDSIIEKEIHKFPEDTQNLFEKLMRSFCSKRKRIMDENEKHKIQDLFLHDRECKKRLELLYRNIREQFNSVN